MAGPAGGAAGEPPRLPLEQDQQQDQPEVAQPEVAEAEAEEPEPAKPPAKRARGRPKGSKDKKPRKKPGQLAAEKAEKAAQKAQAQAQAVLEPDRQRRGLGLGSLRDAVRQFAAERDWDQFHTPRNLLLALVGEVGELSEIFQWRGEVQQGLPDFADEEKERVGEEMADVLIYLVRMADVSGIDLSQAVVAKLQKNTEVRAGREAPAASRRMRKRDGARRSGRKPNGGGAGGD